MTIYPFTPPPRTLRVGLDVAVSATNSVIVNNTGTSQYFGGMGTADTYGYINGWSRLCVDRATSKRQLACQ